MYGPEYGPPDPRFAYPPRSRVRQHEPPKPGKGRLYAMVAAALGGVVAMVAVIALVARPGAAPGDAAAESEGGRQDLQAFVNGAPDQEREAGAQEPAGEDADAAPPAEQAETAQVRLVGPNRATAGRPFQVVAAFRDLPDGARLRAYVQALRPDGRVGETKAVGSCRLDTPGEQDTLTGRCPAVAAGSYRLAVVVERAVQRAGDFPPVDVGRLVVAAAETSANGGSGGSDDGDGDGDGGGSGGGPPPTPDAIREVEQRMVELTNQARREAGRGPLSVDARLTDTSRDWSCDMAAREDLEHDPNFADAGAQGENVAFRTDAGDDVALLLHNQFMNSPGHRENILNPRWGEIGIGFCARNGFWVTERFAP